MDPNANLAEQETLYVRRATYKPGGMRYRQLSNQIGVLQSRFAAWLQEHTYDWEVVDSIIDWPKAPNARKYYGR
jgi:hypothetical protein